MTMDIMPQSSFWSFVSHAPVSTSWSSSFLGEPSAAGPHSLRTRFLLRPSSASLVCWRCRRLFNPLTWSPHGGERRATRQGQHACAESGGWMRRGQASRQPRTGRDEVVVVAREAHLHHLRSVAPVGPERLPMCHPNKSHMAHLYSDAKKSGTRDPNIR